VKSLALILSYLSEPVRRRNLRVVVWLLVVLVALVALFSLVFHVLMAREGRDHSWATGVYWTLTTMSTLGFGDITFESDAGRIFSVVVLLSGALFILVLLPFAFIQFVFTPWMEQREAARAPRRLPDATEGHIVLTGLGPIEEALVRRAERADVPYVVLVPDVPTALSRHDDGYRVMVGALDDPETYRAARVQQAALVATTLPDTTNTNIAFTVREFDATVPIVATASSDAAVDVLGLAGVDRVLQLGRMLGEAMARRVLGDGRAHVVGSIDDLQIAEVAGTGPFAGRRLGELDLARTCGVNVLGVWERGAFRLASAGLEVTPGSVVILAGDAAQIACFDDHHGHARATQAPVVIVGGGRVGRAAGQVLDAAGIGWTIVERRPERERDPDHYVIGDAAEREVLERAGLREASAVLVTTHEDDVNVYLTLYLRRLEPDLQVISRANADRNVSTLHRAGADAVLSYATLGATEIWNQLGPDDSLVLAEGLDVFRVPVPGWMAGRTLAECDVRTRTGANVVGQVARGADRVAAVDAHAPLDDGASLVVIGDADAQTRFYARDGH
jgi:voltage-gated potassium channel